MSKQTSRDEVERRALETEDRAWGTNDQGPPQVEPDPPIAEAILAGLAEGTTVVDPQSLIESPIRVDIGLDMLKEEIDELERLAATLEEDHISVARASDDELGIAISVLDPVSRERCLFYGKAIVTDTGVEAALEPYDRPPEPGCAGQVAIATPLGKIHNLEGFYECAIGQVRADCSFDIIVPKLCLPPIACYQAGQPALVEITVGLDGRAPAREIREIKPRSTIRNLEPEKVIRELPRDEGWDDAAFEDTKLTVTNSTGDVQWWTEPFDYEIQFKELRSFAQTGQLELLVSDSAGGFIGYVFGGHSQDLLEALTRSTTYVYTCNGHVIVVVNTTDRDDAFTTAFERFCEIYDVDDEGDSPELEVLIRQFDKATCDIIHDDDSRAVINAAESELRI